MTTLPAPRSTPAAAQTFLAIRCELKRPTVDLAGARTLLDLHENEIKDLSEQGVFPCWNIARSTTAPRSTLSAPRSERRFLTRAVRDWAEGKPINRDEDFIIRLIYGPEKPFLLGKVFYRAWNCDSGHMCNLVQDRTLQTVKGTTYGQGRGCTPCITWSSAIKFLKDRRIA